MQIAIARIKKNLSFYLIALLFFMSGPSIIRGDTLPPKTEHSVSKWMESTVGPLRDQTNQDLFNFRYQLRILGFLTLISLLPFAVMLLTSFTRISIIFHFLRQALGYQQVPSNQIVIGLSLILTGFIMHPVIQQIQAHAITPYVQHGFKNDPEVVSGQKTEETVMAEKAWAPLRRFLLKHTREKDLVLFLNIAHVQIPQGETEIEMDFNQSGEGEEEETYRLEDVPWFCLIPAFVMSELRIAFMMGFLLFLPFLIIDMVVASILMSMGMMMLPPVLVSTPFKLLLFILIDGWRLIIQQIVSGFSI